MMMGSKAVVAALFWIDTALAADLRVAIPAEGHMWVAKGVWAVG
jgi:hypothetical protein